MVSGFYRTSERLQRKLEPEKHASGLYRCLGETQ